MLNKKRSKYKSIFINTGISTLLIGILSISSVFAASVGMREKTLADIMDETMRTKEMSYLTGKFGAASTVKEYGKYMTFLYKTSDNKGDTCSQVYAIESSTGNIVGWDTNCDITTGRKEYGEISSNIPIPGRVLVPEITRAVAKNKALEKIAQENTTRPMTLADFLASYVGQPEERVLTTEGFQNPQSSQRLDNGKALKKYNHNWIVDNYGTNGYYAGSDIKSCTFFVTFLKGEMVGYDARPCEDKPGLKDKTKTVPANQPPAPWSK